jgi:hypothetical protein
MAGTHKTVTINDLKTEHASVVPPNTSDIYYVTDRNKEGEFYYDGVDTGTSPGDDAITIISNTNRYRFRRVISDHLNVKWFGAMGDGLAFDEGPIRTAIYTVINNVNLPKKIYCPRGIYLINEPIAIFKLENVCIPDDPNTSENEARCFDAYQPVKFSLVGDGRMKDEFGVNWGTEFGCTNAMNNDFILGIQRGYGITIENIMFRGNFRTLGGDQFNQNQIFRKTFNEWNQTGVSAKRFAPHTAINIDPFARTFPTTDGGGYASLQDNYVGGSGLDGYGGSSDIQINNCTFHHFTVGLSVSISGDLPNAEMVHSTGCAFKHCKVAYAVGMDQTRQNFLNDFKAWGYIHTLIDCVNFGAKIGCPPMINGGNIAGGDSAVHQLINMEAGRSPFYCRNLHAESIVKIGNIHPVNYITNTAASFIDCHFNFLGTSPGNVPVADYVLWGHANFVNCILQYLDSNERLGFTRPKFNNLETFVRFEGGSISAPIMHRNSPTYLRERPTSTLHDVLICGRPSLVQTGKSGVENMAPSILHEVVMGQTTKIQLTEKNDFKYSFEWMQATPDLSLYLETADINVDEKGNGKVTLTAASLKRVRIGDTLLSDDLMNWEIHDKNPNYSIASGGTIPNNAYIDTSPLLGVIIDIDTTTREVKFVGAAINIPVNIGVQTTPNVRIYVNWVRQHCAPLACTITTGSNVLTNVENLQNLTQNEYSPPIGMRLEHQVIPPGTYVTAVNSGLQTITLSDNALASVPHASIINGNPKISCTGIMPPDYAAEVIEVNMYEGTDFTVKLPDWFGNEASTYKNYRIQRTTFHRSTTGNPSTLHPLSYTANGTEIVPGFAELRLRYRPDPSIIFLVLEAGKEGFFRADPSDTTTIDDNLNTIVGTIGNAIRIKRVPI